MKNLFHDVPVGLPDEVVDILAERPHVRIERIVSHGHASPPGFWYDQDRAELVVLLRGAAKLELAEGPQSVRLRPGDWLVLEAHEKHRVTWTTPDEPTVWLAVHF